jgi:hydroxymethylpyrimidine pyrophosphatase-like HAD family hydrolase
VSETNSEYIDIELILQDYITKFGFQSSSYSSAVKCILLEEPTYLREVERLKTMPHLSVSMSKPFLEVAQNGIDKDKHKIVAEKLGIHQSEIIAVGNAGNDLAMIEYAGLGVWVDNVDPELRQSRFYCSVKQ